MNSPPTITIGAFNWLQEHLEGFPHNSKSVVVAMTPVSSPMESSDLLWNFLVLWNRENFVTKSYQYKRCVSLSKKPLIDDLWCPLNTGWNGS